MEFPSQSSPTCVNLARSVCVCMYVCIRDTRTDVLRIMKVKSLSSNKLEAFFNFTSGPSPMMESYIASDSAPFPWGFVSCWER